MQQAFHLQNDKIKIDYAVIKPDELQSKIQASDAELAARGTLYSYTFVHMPLFGSHNVEHAEGYGVGQIDLPEGPRVQAPLAGKQAEFRVGLAVQGELDLLRTNDAGQDVVIVRFRPVGESA